MATEKEKSKATKTTKAAKPAKAHNATPKAKEAVASKSVKKVTEAPKSQSNEVSGKAFGAEIKKTTTKSKGSYLSKTFKVAKVHTYGTGKRKSAIAKVWLFEGSGNVVVNNLSVSDYFQSPILIDTAVKPLELLALRKKYDAKISVQGGGKVGQADACKLGFARAILELNETFREKLREHGFLSRDPRIKERKKYGRKRARKGFQFRKR